MNELLTGIPGTDRVKDTTMSVKRAGWMDVLVETLEETGGGKVREEGGASEQPRWSEDDCQRQR